MELVLVTLDTLFHCVETVTEDSMVDNVNVSQHWKELHHHMDWNSEEQEFSCWVTTLSTRLDCSADLVMEQHQQHLWMQPE